MGSGWRYKAPEGVGKHSEDQEARKDEPGEVRYHYFFALIRKRRGEARLTLLASASWIASFGTANIF